MREKSILERLAEVYGTQTVKKGPSLGKITGLALGTLALGYITLGLTSPDARKAREEISEVYSEFEKIVEEEKPRVYKVNNQIGDAVTALDYNGLIDEKLEQRDNILKKHGVIGVGKWLIHDGALAGTYDTSNNLTVFDPTPYK